MIINQLEPPTDRKPWEVAKIFVSSSHYQGFFSSLILDLARRKVIEIKTEKNNIYLKTLKEQDKEIDDIEQSFLHLLNKIKREQDNSLEINKKIKNNEFIKMPEIMVRKFFKNKEEQYVLNPVYAHTNSLADEKIRKQFYPAMSITRKIIFFSVFCLLAISMTITNEKGNLLYFFILLSILFIFFIFNIKYFMIKPEYRDEMKKWASFRNYISENKHIDDHGHDGIVLWGKWYCYGVALGAIKGGFFPIIKND